MVLVMASIMWIIYHLIMSWTITKHCIPWLCVAAPKLRATAATPLIHHRAMGINGGLCPPTRVTATAWVESTAPASAAYVCGPVNTHINTHINLWLIAVIHGSQSFWIVMLSWWLMDGWLITSYFYGWSPNFLGAERWISSKVTVASVPFGTAISPLGTSSWGRYEFRRCQGLVDRI